MANRLSENRMYYQPPRQDPPSISQSLIDILRCRVGRLPQRASVRDWYRTVALHVHDQLMARRLETVQRSYAHDTKRVYYLSLEFLMGRALSNAALSLGVANPLAQALQGLGCRLEDLAAVEPDPALGNGGLGRLAACFLDSLATLDLPAYGYGIRYEYGMFQQRIERGAQVEMPDSWLRFGNPWEFPRHELMYTVQFGGRVESYRESGGAWRYQWQDTDVVMAMAYDVPVPGFDTDTVNSLRLWSARASHDFDLQRFNAGDYIKSVEEKSLSENLSKVLYPDDSTVMGRTLRLKQQYFFVSASLQDIIYRYLKDHDDFTQFPDKVAIQLNDTHPSIAIPELMRIFLDEQLMGWDEAWDLCSRTFAYTCHTLMPEALEKWPVGVFESLLPRHLMIIHEINHRFLMEVGRKYPGDSALLRRVSLIEEGGDGTKLVRMAYLAIVGSHKVNGVAALHTKLMQETIFADFHALFPGKIISITNGITPRRWLNSANPDLADLISEFLGERWKTQLHDLGQLAPLAEDCGFQQRFAAIKRRNKMRLATLIEKQAHVKVSPDSLFDVQVKRIHEYKRQLLNVLHIITRYNRIKADPGNPGHVPRTVIFSGKAAAGYAMAKLIIHLINDVATVVNQDPDVGDLLKVVFFPNYNVSVAEAIIPAADLSEQISTAGSEASGTGNMKLALNGALTIGTLDGANLEMLAEIGAENMFVFGLTADEVLETRRQGYRPWEFAARDAELSRVLEMIGSGYFSPAEPARYRSLADSLLGRDEYLLLADYAAYVAAQERVDALYAIPDEWTRRAILNVAGMGRFSSDRTVAEYAEQIWQVRPVSR